jgi:hypothetical protein
VREEKEREVVGLKEELVKLERGRGEWEEQLNSKVV